MKLKKIQPTVIFSFLFVFLVCSAFAAASDSLSLNKAIFQDSDGDGLSDGEEQIYGTDPAKSDTDNDGYSDGVEVQSGYDPLKPAPGDKLVSVGSAVLGENTQAEELSEDNLTSQLSQGLYDFIKENEGQEGSLSVENLDTIIDQSIGDEINQDFSASIDENLIKVKKQDYSSLSVEERSVQEKKDATEYFKTILLILVNNAPAEITSAEELNSVAEEFTAQFQGLVEGAKTDYFVDLAQRGKIVKEELVFVEVPEKLLDLHKEGLDFMLQALELEKITIDPSDPVQLVVDASKINNVIEQGSAFQKNFTLRMDEYEVKSGLDLIFSE